MLEFLTKMFSDDNHKWHRMDKRLSLSFEKVRADARLVFSWIKYLREKDTQNDKTHEKISYQLGQHQAKLERLTQEIDALKRGHREFRPGSVRTWSEPKSEPRKRTSIEQRIIRKIRPKKGEYVADQVLQLAENGGYSTKDIERIVVEEKGLCGRTSFYSYLKELRHKNLIADEKVDGRKVLVLP